MAECTTQAGTRKIMVLLEADGVVHIDHFVAEVSHRMRFSLRRSAAIRAMLGAVKDSGVELLDIASERELRQRRTHGKF